MSPAFVNNVAGPQIYSEALVTISLWKEKVRLADRHPFDAAKDVSNGALDIIWAVTFGSEMGTSKNQFTLLSGLENVALADNTDAAVQFPAASDPAAFKALIKLSDSVEIALHSPIPRLHHGLALRLMPSLISAKKVKDQLLKSHIDAAWEKLQHNENEDAVKSALDLVVQREAIMAKKDGRPAQYDTQAIRDELFGFLTAGFDTTSTTICWGLKFLTRGLANQAMLRSALQAEFKRAREAGDNPTVDEITKANVPYLDATLEEMHRCGGTASGNIRTTLEDTEVLGHLIPKGTDVFLMTNGPGYVDTPLPVEESKRSQSSQDSKDKTGSWEVFDISVFAPGRWLVKGESGKVEFNPRAGPAHQFGAGPRGCFGRRLASLELKIMVTLIIWNFELHPTPAALSSFAGQDKLTHAPQQCYLRLAEVKH
ncbi:hypothetical protein LTR08_005215 [Meristemomyces frigidus]|nr:hypothetical protein LTR08_005215 [Meristemomyces frigidus]